MKNKRIKIIGLVVCGLLLIYCIGGIVFSKLSNKIITKDNARKEGLTINGFAYILYDDDLEIYKTEFKKLKKNLESSTINYQEYSNSVAKLFLIDLYSLNDKLNMYDVGGTEFIYPNNVDNYKLNVENTLYKYMKDNSVGDRKQNLPEVKSVKINKEEETIYSIGEKSYEGYKINLSIEYVKDLGYDKSVELILIKDDKYVYVVEKN